MNAAAVETVDACNARISRGEVEAFKARTATGSYTAYLTKDENFCQQPGPAMAMGVTTRYRITTWMGDTLADVISIKSHRVHRGYLTDTRGSFWARGIDGRIYHGRHNGAGIYCRMRLAKAQP